MRNSYTRLVLSLAVIGGLAALWVMPSYARQQVPGTFARPGMTEARVWVNNKGLEESIPVNITAIDPKAPPLPVAVANTVPVDAKALRQPWEYRSVDVSGDQDPARALNVFGADGWEAVSMTALPGAKVTVLLKRPR